MPAHTQWYQRFIASQYVGYLLYLTEQGCAAYTDCMVQCISLYACYTNMYLKAHCAS